MDARAFSAATGLNSEIVEEKGDAAAAPPGDAHAQLAVRGGRKANATLTDMQEENVKPGITTS